MNKMIYLSGISLLVVMPAAAQQVTADSAAIMKEHTLSNVTITSRKATMRSLKGALSGKDISRDELFKAACCNLGESFVTNPSVDVNYSDATTGAKQVKLLGLSGTYVQMLTENLPNFRGAALPYGLGYVPGEQGKLVGEERIRSHDRTNKRGIRKAGRRRRTVVKPLWQYDG